MPERWRKLPRRVRRVVPGFEKLENVWLDVEVDGGRYRIQGSRSS